MHFQIVSRSKNVSSKDVKAIAAAIEPVLRAVSGKKHTVRSGEVVGELWNAVDGAVIIGNEGEDSPAKKSVVVRPQNQNILRGVNASSLAAHVQDEILKLAEISPEDVLGQDDIEVHVTVSIGEVAVVSLRAPKT